LKGKTILSLLLLASMFAVAFPLNTCAAQEIPREDTVYTSSSWQIPGWNILLGVDSCSYMVGIMYPTLYLYSAFTDEWIPYLAESYRWVDKYTLELKIRGEAKWWDGVPITAKDVKYSADLGKKYTIPWATPMWDYITEVKAVDDKTVQIFTSGDKLNYFQILSILFQQNLFVLPEHRWSALEAELGGKIITEFKDDVAAKIVGGGPYKLLRWSEEAYYYQRVDDWWGKAIFGLPNPKYLAHRMYKDNVAVALAYEAGDVDMMTHFTPKIWEIWEVKKLARRTYYSDAPYYRNHNIVVLFINWKKPLDDPNVRRAIAYALPYQDMISKAYFNYSVQASPSLIHHLGPSAQWIDEALVKKYGYGFDLNEAKSILDAAGIKDKDGDGVREMPDGTELGPYTIQVPYGWSDWMMMCDMISANLRSIGIDCATEFPDFSVWWDRLGKANYDIVIGWTADIGFNHPWNVFRVVLDPRLKHPAGNWENYPNTDSIPLIDAIPKETDAAKLKTIYTTLQEMVLKDLPCIPLFYGATWYEYSDDYWVGWPKEEFDPWFSNFWNWPSNMPVWFYLVKKGQTPTKPAWIDALKVPTSKIFGDLGVVIKPPPVTTTATIPTTVATAVTAVTTVEKTVATTIEKTSLQTVETTVQKEVPTMDLVSIAGAAIVALIVGLLVGRVTKREK